MVNLVAVQMTSTPNVEENLHFVEASLANTNIAPNSVVVLPECFACFGTKDINVLKHAEVQGSGLIQERLATLAKLHQCYIVSGTFPEQVPNEDKFSAACYVFGPTGEVLAGYRKIHLFDVSVDDATGSYKESNCTKAGSEVVTVKTDVGVIGLAVCYDVRFPGLFQAMGDIDILVLPAAFTQKTGEAHWHTLIQARAVEKQCFVVAANQTGVHVNNRETYGHSMIVSPWGEVLAQQEKLPGCIQVQCELELREKLKRNMPIAQHNRFRSQFV